MLGIVVDDFAGLERLWQSSRDDAPTSPMHCAMPTFSAPIAAAPPCVVVGRRDLMARPAPSESEDRGFVYRPDLVPEDFLVAEIFGFPAEADTPGARSARDRCWCPFQDRPCTKLRTAAGTGVCAIRYKAKGFSKENVWAVCAKRLAGAPFEHATREHFGERASEAELVTEVKISDPDMSFDGVMFVLGAGDPPPVEFAGIEAQTIDTRGGAVRPLWQSYVEGRPDRWREYYEPGKLPPGVNTTNVWKRMLPQAMNKGRMFRDWDATLFVILQATLFNFIRRRMPFTGLSPQEHAAAEVIWLPWDYTGSVDPATGAYETIIGEPVRTTVDEIENAFVSVASAQRLAFIDRFLQKAARDDERAKRARRRVRDEARRVDESIMRSEPDASDG